MPVGCIDHLSPSQRSASVAGAPEPGNRAPTAMHAVGDEQEMALRTACPRLGVRWMDHRVPFHFSASVNDLRALSLK